MSDEKNNPEDEPQLFAVKKGNDGGWQFSRREFIKGAGATATVLGMGGIIGGVTNAEEIPALTPPPNGARSHIDSVKSLAISPDGTLLASGSWDNTIKLWSLPDGGFLTTLEGHTNRIQSVVISPDGTLLASGSSDKTIKLWSLPDGALLKTLQLTDFVMSVAISFDGTLLASGSADNTIKLWSLPDGELFKTLEGHTYSVDSLAISPDGTLLASGSEDGIINLWSLPPKQIQTVVRVIRNVRARSEPTTSGGDATVVKTLVVGELLLIREGIEAVQADNYTWIPIILDGQDAWVAQEGFVELVEQLVMPQPEIIKTIRGYVFSTVISLAINPDGTLLASCSPDNTIKLWSLPDGTLLNTLNDNSHATESVAISPDGTLLVSGNYDDTIRLWSLPGGRLIRTLEGHTSFVHSVAISPDGTLLASGSYDKTIRLWSLPDGSYLQTLIDIAVSEPDFQGTLYSPNDEGSSVITLPCGLDIPAGSTCICNCVAGGGCSCVGNFNDGTHYWYPN